MFVNRAGRRFSGLSFLSVLVLAACGGAVSVSSSPPASSALAASKPAAASSGGAASGAPSGSASAGAASSAGAAAKPSGAASGSPASSPAGSAAASGPVKLGIVNPLTGPQGTAGIDYKDGFQLYLDSVNSTIGGRKIEPTFVDDQAQADTGLTKTKQLVEGDKVPALMGFTFTPVTYAAATYVKSQAHIPMLVTTATTGQALMLDPQFTSPYLMRFTSVAAAHSDITADWAYKQGFRKMAIVGYDTAAGVETSDLVASAFISRGGTVVQEAHPPLGTTDFGPYLAQLDPSADVVAIWEPASDGVHFLQQFGNYTGQKKPVVIDMGGAASGGALTTLGDAGVGVVVETDWADSLPNSQNQAFLKAFQAKFPSGRDASPLMVQGWSTGAILEPAFQKVNGNIENGQAFLNALYGTDAQTAMGEIKLDPSTHDVVRDYYITKIAKRSNGRYGYDVVDTYHNVSQFWDRTPADLKAFPYGKEKGKWVGMTKDQLTQLHGITTTPAAS